MITTPDKLSPKKQVFEKLAIEKEFWSRGLMRVAGLDEAGRGCLAGPVCAAVVVLKPFTEIAGVDDSKKLNPKKRDELYDRICDEALAYAVSMVEVEEIDRINILQASLLAMSHCVHKLNEVPEQLLIDGNQKIALTIPQKTVVDGDSLSMSIGAASILAKVTRDRYMIRLDEEFPEYSFAQHKGYGTSQHLKALHKHGPSRHHRKSFAPVAQLSLLL